MTAGEIQARAQYYRTALLLGLRDGLEVVAWADEVIASGAEVPAELLEVSLTPALDLSALRHALLPLAGDGASAETVQAMLALCAGDHAAGRRSIADTVRVLAQMRRMVVLPDWLEHELDVLEDDHMLAVAGVRGEVGEVEARVGRFLDGRR